MTAGLRQKDAAKQLRVNEWTYRDWEQGKYIPSIRQWPKLITYLGFDPNPCPTSFGERLICLRRRTGLSASEFGTLYGLDEGTVLRFEAGKGNQNDPRVRTAANALRAAFTQYDI